MFEHLLMAKCEELGMEFSPHSFCVVCYIFQPRRWRLRVRQRSVPNQVETRGLHDLIQPEIQACSHFRFRAFRHLSQSV